MIFLARCRGMSDCGSSRLLNIRPSLLNTFELLLDVLSPATRFDVTAVEDEVENESEGDDGADGDADLESRHGFLLVVDVELLRGVKLTRVVFVGRIHDLGDDFVPSSYCLR